MYDLHVEVNLDSIDALAKKLEAELERALARTAFTVEAFAKAGAPVDTGALRASIYTALSGQSFYNAASVGANQMRKEVKLHPEATPERHEAIVTPSVQYWRHVEEGTKKMPGRFYMKKAADKGRTVLEREVTRAIRRARRR